MTLTVAGGTIPISDPFYAALTGKAIGGEQLRPHVHRRRGHVRPAGRQHRAHAGARRRARRHVGDRGLSFRQSVSSRSTDHPHPTSHEGLTPHVPAHRTSPPPRRPRRGRPVVARPPRHAAARHARRPARARARSSSTSTRRRSPRWCRARPSTRSSSSCGPAWSEVSTTVAADLAALADEDGGRWLLARIDAEANPQIAQAFQAQSRADGRRGAGRPAAARCSRAPTRATRCAPCSTRCSPRPRRTGSPGRVDARPRRSRRARGGARAGAAAAAPGGLRRHRARRPRRGPRRVRAGDQGGPARRARPRRPRAGRAARPHARRRPAGGTRRSGRRPRRTSTPSWPSPTSTSSAARSRTRSAGSSTPCARRSAPTASASACGWSTCSRSSAATTPASSPPAAPWPARSTDAFAAGQGRLRADGDPRHPAADLPSGRRACVLFSMSPGREERTPRIEPRWLVPRTTSPEAPTGDHIAGHRGASGTRSSAPHPARTALRSTEASLTGRANSAKLERLPPDRLKDLNGCASVP